MDMLRSLLDILLSIMENIIYIIYILYRTMHAVSMSAWYGKSGIGLSHEIEVILLKIFKALLLVNNQ